jgi:hypothetical protein
VTTTTEYTPHTDPLVEIERLKLAVRVERERRVMAALWGSLDTDCPSAFSLYRRAEDTPDGEDHGVLAYGVKWADGAVTVRWVKELPRVGSEDGTYTMRTFDTLTDLRYRLADGVTLVWLSEDVNDLDATIRDGVEDEMYRRAQSDEVRDTVARALLYAEPTELTWTQCQDLARAALVALFRRSVS